MFLQLFATSDRSLEQAYQAALKIKNIEEEFFNGNKIPINSNDNSVSSNIKTEFEKNIGTIQLKIAEFKAKQSEEINLNSNQLVKLKFIDEILTKYGNKKIGNISLASGASSNGGKSDSITQKNGLLPRSIGKTIGKIFKDLDPNAEQEALREFRRSRTKTVVASRLILTLIIVPILVHFLSKHFLVNPIVEKVRGETQQQVFLNYEMKEKAFKELSTFEEELKFESEIAPAGKITSEEIEEKVREKAAEIAEESREESSNALSNVFADLIAVASFGVVLLFSQKEVTILKSFLDGIVYGLSDSAKAFGIILVTDIFVGFHSPHGWEVLLEAMAEHLGVPANESLIFLFIATVPVFMDTMLKYWIFRYLSRMSPSTVATLKEMNE